VKIISLKQRVGNDGELVMGHHETRVTDHTRVWTHWLSFMFSFSISSPTSMPIVCSLPFFYLFFTDADKSKHKTEFSLQLHEKTDGKLCTESPFNL
jgi:hypothetical protein